LLVFTDFYGYLEDMASRQILGPAVRALRDSRDIRGVVLAAQAGITPGYLTLIEQGKRRPSADVIARIARGLGVDVGAISYFVPGGEEKAA
jgi:transcriptional regulator with XRE-family HTH domain